MKFLQKLHWVLFIMVLFVMFPCLVQAQKDSLVFRNNNVMVGEIKSLDKGVLKIETPYSDDDFTIKWSEVRSIFSETRFLMTLDDGRRLNGVLETGEDGVLLIHDPEGGDIRTSFGDLVYLKGLKSAFWSRVSASVDLGFSFTRANNLKQFSFQSAAGYLGDTWETGLYFNEFHSSQDSVASTKRKEAGLNYKYYLQHDWFLSAALTYLSNTEQALSGRYTGKIGAGRFFIHTNSSYWGVGGGLSFVAESFSNETANRKSAEAYLGSELNLFDTGDLNLISSLYVYPSLTESKRLRSDFKLESKYEFASDFYVKLTFNLDYDNQPAIAGRETDYVFGVSVGWEL